ncbi:DUF3500 domain-containing protein [Qipengyuania soli]|uniref:DUF3500 domain-containing protein n=1 Tax=Qipengyuania soli TaxID=2782568 RepID=A0A7S8IU30_9SPHN|nr:DUF3500 domain-containing protein [Qipengyuania soli]QPC98087.1 DUF3500 domain-containing protein [Qipengyuania soli]
MVQHTAHHAMGDAATAFLATLDDDQRKLLVTTLDDEAARTDWSNLPSAMYPRTGLPLSALDDRQRIAFHDLMAAAMSGQGYAEATTIMWIDDLLRGIESDRLASGQVPEDRRAQAEAVMQSRGSGNYWLRFFGEPASARWGWMINGHHFAANFTVVDGRIAFTPLFLGSNPQIVQSGPYAGWRVLDHEMVDGFALFASLNPDQRAAALAGPEVTGDIFTGKGAKDAPRAPLGLSADRMTPNQRERLIELIADFVGFANNDAAKAQLAAVRADGPANLRLAWWGSPDDRSKRFMYRIAGPSILIEYTREGQPDGSPSNHVHAIVRDPRNDYGEDWLRRHYTEAPHP